MGDQVVDQIVVCGVFDQVFVCGKDFGDGNNISFIEVGVEIFKEVVQMCVVMWLVDGDYVVFVGLVGSFQYGGDFYRVVVVIVDDCDVIDFVYFGKMMVYFIEFCQSFVDFIQFYVQMMCYSNGI